MSHNCLLVCRLLVNFLILNVMFCFFLLLVLFNIEIQRGRLWRVIELVFYMFWSTSKFVWRIVRQNCLPFTWIIGHSFLIFGILDQVICQVNDQKVLSCMVVWVKFRLATLVIVVNANLQRCLFYHLIKVLMFLTLIYCAY